MAIVIKSEDCGNSPKNLLLQNLTIALAEREIKNSLVCVTEDIQWEIIGERLIAGKTSLVKLLQELQSDPLSELEIHHVVSHGKAGAVDGVAKMEDGRKNRFCHVFEFAGAKSTLIRRILSYELPE